VSDDDIVVGRIVGVFGVRGWCKVFSHSRPREQILSYTQWHIGQDKNRQVVTLQEGKVHGEAIIVKLDGIDDRNQAAALKGSHIWITPSQLERLESDEYYWRQLIGLEVIDQAGVLLGKVDGLIETGANDVLLVKAGKQEHLIPFIMDQVVTKIDIETGQMSVDWDIDY
jgi:16S rRNA processing protein RimM